MWCLAFSDPLPTSFIFVSVQVIGCLSAAVLYQGFFLRLRSCSFGTVWKGCERIVFGLPELGLWWRLAFSDPLPAVFRTQPRSEGAGHKKCFMDSKGDGKHFVWLVFLACLSSACCGVWPCRIRCPRASFLCVCRL